MIFKNYVVWSFRIFIYTFNNKCPNLITQWHILVRSGTWLHYCWCHVSLCHTIILSVFFVSSLGTRFKCLSASMKTQHGADLLSASLTCSTYRYLYIQTQFLPNILNDLLWGGAKPSLHSSRYALTQRIQQNTPPCTSKCPWLTRCPHRRPLNVCEVHIWDIFGGWVDIHVKQCLLMISFTVSTTKEGDTVPQITFLAEFAMTIRPSLDKTRRLTVDIVGSSIHN